MRSSFTCLIGSILFAVLSSCSNKADDIIPKKSVISTSEKSADLFKFKATFQSVKLSQATLAGKGTATTASRTYTTEEAYEIGRKRGAADVLALASQFAIPCPNIDNDWTPPPSEHSGPTPVDSPPPLTPVQGGNAPCMYGYDRQRLDEAVIAWRNAALNLVNTSTTLEEQWYYMGYAQGVLEWELPPR